jgi:PIN domain nuclease of toxin-antitoxin system
VLDASALLAWLVLERGAEVVGEYLPRAVISAVNLAEVLYRGQSLGRKVATLPSHLGLGMEPFTTEDALVAGRREVLAFR